jgi:hypothetical protein
MRQLMVLALIAVVLRGQSAFGTLIIILPANSGVVVAADTRQVFRETPCDGLTKIIRPKNRKNTLVLIAGTPIVFLWDRPPKKPCEYLRRVKPSLDIGATVVRSLDKRARDVLSEDEVRRIAHESFADVSAFDRAQRGHHPLDYYITHTGFQVNIVGYDAKNATVLIGGFGIYVDSAGAPQLRHNTPFYKLSTMDKWGYKLLGEREFAKKYVQAPLEMAAVEGKPVGQATLKNMKSAALKYIIAAEKAASSTMEVEHVDDIGGAVDVATITEKGIQIDRH